MLPEREHNDRTIHESTTVSIWEEDYSWCKEAIDDLKKKGVTDFRQYFENHPDLIRFIG